MSLVEGAKFLRQITHLLTAQCCPVLDQQRRRANRAEGPAGLTLPLYGRMIEGRRARGGDGRELEATPMEDRLDDTDTARGRR
jgi:hypothetical protein